MIIYYLISCLVVSCIKETFSTSIAEPADAASTAGSTQVIENKYSGGYKVDEAHVSLTGNVKSTLVNSSTFKSFSDLDVTKLQQNICPADEDADRLTQTQLINRLTAPCHYDRLLRPPAMENGSVSSAPVKVYVRIYIYVLQNMETNDLQFKLYGLIQMRYIDSRLQFAKYAPNRTESIMGESSLRDLIWVPHTFLANEHSSNVLGTNEKDILTAIRPDGTVIISSRIRATLYCWMKLQKFPFDEQFCPTVLESWMYNSSELLLYWEEHDPVAFDPKMHLTEYSLQAVWTNETIIKADLSDLRHGAFAGNYSSISFTVHLTREVGYYVMDYFLPSIMIVAISWVSFWLQADQTPARTTLGCTTLLAFITLASSQDKNLPKVSYIKISEVWFLGCTCFIFGSLVEFAFVNTIWRRKQCVEVKKIKSKYILKSTLTPNVKRQKIMNNHSSITRQCERYLAAVESPVTITVDEEIANKNKSTQSISSRPFKPDKSENKNENKHPRNNCWATMTPHEASLWIDRKARFVFPLSFIIFNAIFWTFVYCL